MYLLYSFLIALGLTLMLPRFMFDFLRNGKYSEGFTQKLGHLPLIRKNGNPVLWVHCVSVGETNAAVPLIRSILEKYPNFRLVVSTTTKTGQELAKKHFEKSADLVFYFPFDLKFAVRRALKSIRPNVILLMETEIWFNFIRESNKSGAGVFIVNGRLSERSFRRFLHIRKFTARVFHHLTLALMQSKKDEARIKQLGIRPAKVKVTGNIKFDQAADETDVKLTEAIRSQFDIRENDQLIIAASTHDPEEILILKAFRNLTANSGSERIRLMLVPRHPERFDRVVKLAEDLNIAVGRRSAVSKTDKTADVIVLDSVGELRSALPLAEIVFVGGSLIPHGGQNILEPAMAKKAIVTGFHTFNFEAAVKEFLRSDALIQLPDLGQEQLTGALTEAFSKLLKNKELREKMVEKAYRVIADNRGATGTTIGFLEPYLSVQSCSLDSTQ